MAGLSAGRGEGPGGVVVVEAEVDQSFQVDDRGSGGERDLVAVDAAVSAASVAVGDEPGNGAFDERTVLAVVADQVSVGTPSRPVRSQVLIVFADQERLAIDC